MKPNGFPFGKVLSVGFFLVRLVKLAFCHKVKEAVLEKIEEEEKEYSLLHTIRIYIHNL